MDHFQYQQNELYAEDICVEQLAKQYGTPLFVYSKATLTRHFHAFSQAFGNKPHLICYAVKANSNLAVLQLLAGLGSGFDIVSGGELERVIKAGGDPSKVVFSGLNKTADEIRLSLKHGIKCFNIESEAEIDLIQSVAKSTNKIAEVSIRVNPDVNPKTHPYISTGLKKNKFGIDINKAPKLYRKLQTLSHINAVGLDLHIGSQLCSLSPYEEAIDLALQLLDQLKHDGIRLQHLDVGGGLGISYNNETPPKPTAYVKSMLAKTKKHDIELIIEPGRAISANAGILITKLGFIKNSAEKNFAVVDAAMNDLIRPALYQSTHKIISATKRQDATIICDIVGPVCETGDFFAKDYPLTAKVGDVLAIRSAGAYAMVMASNYNSRNRAAEIMVDGKKSYLIRRRETIEDQMALESLIPTD